MSDKMNFFPDSSERINKHKEYAEIIKSYIIGGKKAYDIGVGITDALFGDDKKYVSSSPPKRTGPLTDNERKEFREYYKKKKIGPFVRSKGRKIDREFVNLIMGNNIEEENLHKK